MSEERGRGRCALKLLPAHVDEEEALVTAPEFGSRCIGARREQVARRTAGVRGGRAGRGGEGHTPIK